MKINFENRYTKLNKNLFSFVKPEKIKNPEILILNKKLLNKLNIVATDEELTQIFSGNNLLTTPIAQAYAGHQFGHFTILGDGRALLLGEIITDKKERHDIQLKGSGITPYSRGGDGRASVSAMLREYIYSKALTRLNVKSSQSLAVILTNEKVFRKNIEDGAILVRVMKSHIRIGTFEYILHTGSKEILLDFADYVIERHYPELLNKKDKYLHLFESVMDVLIDMVINWFRLGFIHGVMNTDNMSITGETFDYGPCAFMNYYDPATVFSSIDLNGRYSFKNQKEILLWNLARFGETLFPIIDQNQEIALTKLNNILQNYYEKFDNKFYSMMRLKLGIEKKIECKELINNFLIWLYKERADYTNTFIELMKPNSFDDEVYKSQDFEKLRIEIGKIGLDEKIMKKFNPYYIPRNYLVEQALEEYIMHGSMEKFKQLLKVIEHPYKENKNFRKYQKPPDRFYDENYKTYCNT